MICIYVEFITERLLYTFDFVFKERGIEFELTNDPNYFIETRSLRLNYSNRSFKSGLQLLPATLLFEESFLKKEPVESTFNTIQCLEFEGITDVLASIFFVLSRYEEYKNSHKDIHDRFLASASIQYKYNWLETCICERWSLAFINFLNIHLDGNLEFNKPSYSYRPSFDIDNTFAFRWKTGIRKLGAIARDWIRRDKLRLSLRKEVLKETTKDPYDTFDQLKKYAKEGLNPLIFWHLGSNGQYDRNISWQDLRHQALIQEMNEYCEVSLHPSYKSNASIEILKEEQDHLSEILNKQIQISRQHFLKLEFPKSYQKMIELGFTDDYTMGFADNIGFRAGTSRSHYFFDLEKNERTSLKIHPFCYMDGTLHDYMKLTISESKDAIQILINEVKHFGGEFICIWHNETIGDFGKWNGWKEVLEFTNQHAK